MTILEIIKELNIRKGYSPVYGECKISIKIDGTAIIVSKGENHLHYLNEEGKIIPEGECLIFPSKDNRDWEIELEKSKQFLPVNTPIMMSDSGESWSLGYYQNNKWCKPFKNSGRSSHWKYIVPVANFNFEDPESNIKKSIKITEK